MSTTDPEHLPDIARLALSPSESERALPPELIASILACLPQPALAPCLRVNSTWYRLALPLLYHHIAIPPIQAGTYPHDVRDAAPKPHAALRGPRARALASASSRLDVHPSSLVRELTIPAHAATDPACAPVDLRLRTLHILLGSSAEIHTGARSGDALQALLQRGQAVGGRAACPILSSLTAHTLEIHGAGLLFSRLRPSLLPPTLAPRRIVLRCPPDRALAGASAKFEYPWAGGAGVLAFLAGFDAHAEAVLVFDVPPGERWKPIPRPKDGAEDGVPCWLARVLRALAKGVGHRRLTVVNARAALEDPEAMAELERSIAARGEEAGCEPLRFVELEAWERACRLWT